MPRLKVTHLEPSPAYITVSVVSHYTGEEVYFVALRGYRAVLTNGQYFYGVKTLEWNSIFFNPMGTVLELFMKSETHKELLERYPSNRFNIYVTPFQETVLQRIEMD